MPKWSQRWTTKSVELDEGAGIEEKIDAFVGGQLAGVVLAAGCVSSPPPRRDAFETAIQLVENIGAMRVSVAVRFSPGSCVTSVAGDWDMLEESWGRTVDRDGCGVGLRGTAKIVTSTCGGLNLSVTRSQIGKG